MGGSSSKKSSDKGKDHLANYREAPIARAPGDGKGIPLLCLLVFTTDRKRFQSACINSHQDFWVHSYRFQVLLLTLVLINTTEMCLCSCIFPFYLVI